MFTFNNKMFKQITDYSHTGLCYKIHDSEN